MKDVLKRLVNELPTIAVAVWAVLNAFGVNVGEDQQATFVEAAQSVGAFAIWLLVRRNTDGPVTALSKPDRPGTPGEIHERPA